MTGRRGFAALVLAALAWAATSAAAPAAAPSKASKPTAVDSNAVLVRVGSETITWKTVNDRLLELPEQYRSTYATPDGKQQLLDRLVEERVWLQDATKHGVPQRPAVQRQLEQQKRDLLIRTWVNEVMAQNPAPTDSEAKVYYDSHVNDFKTPATVSMRHIELKTELEARRVLALARAKGADWNKLVTQFTRDTLTKPTGGSLGTSTRDGAFASIGSQPALAESALALKDGDIAGPYKTNRGWHVIKIDHVTADGVRTFDQVKSFVTRQLSQSRTQSFYTEQLAKVKASIGVKTDSNAVRSFISARKSARDMFTEAQAAGDAPARIKAYRAVVDAWPDADVTPQSLFMVGFIQSEELKDYDAAEKTFRELLQRYPKSELTNSAQWMVDHMRTEEAPNFISPEGDSSATHAHAPQTKRSK